MNRERWKSRFDATEGKTAPWPCPTCEQTLTVAPGTVHFQESRGSREAQSHPAWEPEWIDRRFTCMLTCSCGESIAALGRQGVEQSPDPSMDDFFNNYEDVSEPLFFHPALRLISIPLAVPDSVREQLEQSFALFWSDTGSCANRIRASVERLLDHLGVKRTHVTKEGKRGYMSPHARIELFRKAGGSLSHELMALKWLGNAGSHTSPIVRDDLLDGYEIMEHVLREVFEQPAKRIARIARTINRTKKPRSVSSRTRRRT